MHRPNSARSRVLVVIPVIALLAGTGACGGQIATDSSGAPDAKTGTTTGGTGGTTSGSGGTSGSSGGDTGGSDPTTGGGAGGTTGGAGGTGGGGAGGPATGTAMCSDNLTPVKLASVSDAIAALAAPFPGAWQLCAGYTFYECRQDAPYLAFDASGTHASCGNLYEGGFKADSTIAITITQDETGTIFVRWPIPDGTATVILQAFTDPSGGRVLTFSQHGDPPPPPTMMVPAPPLP